MDPMVDLHTNLVNNRGSSNSNWGNMSISSMGNSRGSMGNNRGSMGNNRSSIGSMGNSWGSNSMSSRVSTSYQTMAKSKTVSISKNLSISISFRLSNRGSRAATNHRKNNKEFHLDPCLDFRQQSPC